MSVPRLLGSRRAFELAALMAGVVLAATVASGQERFRRTPPLPDPKPRELRLPSVVRTTLPNGLAVAAAPRPEQPFVTLQLVVRAGEADSPPDLPGVATLTARMIGTGSRFVSGDDLEAWREAVGADFAADVLMDYTVLRVDVLKESLDRAVFLLRQMVLDAAFSEREFAAVKRTSYWELYGRRRNPEVLGWWLLLRTLFENHPYRTAFYSEDVIKYVTVRDVSAFYGRYYRPENSAIVFSGEISAEEAETSARRHFGAWASRPVQKPAVPPPTPTDRERICFIENVAAADATVYVGNVIMDSASPDFFPFIVLKQILGGTTRSRLFMNLRESRGIAYYAFSETEMYRHSGAFWARARVRPEAVVPAVREIDAEIRALASVTPAPAEIEEAKSFLVGNLSTRFEPPAGFAEWLARRVALDLGEDQWDRGPELFKLVNVEQVAAAARKYLAAKPLVVIVGRPDWLDRHLQDFNNVEVYDINGILKEIRRQGEPPCP